MGDCAPDADVILKGYGMTRVASATERGAARYVEALLFALLVIYPVIPQLWYLDTFTVDCVERLDSDMQILDLVQHATNPNLTEWLPPLFRLYTGQCHASGVSPVWNLFLLPFFKLFGIRPAAISIASIACHILLALFLWLLVRWSFPASSVALFAAVLFLSPWYQAAIFARSYVSLSMVLFLLALTLLLRALEQGRSGLLVLAGLVSGLNIYGYAPYRAYSLILAGILFAVLAWRRHEPLAARLKKLGSFTLPMLAVLNVNLLRPWRTVSVMFYTQETITGHIYQAEVARYGMPGLILRNIGYFFTDHGLRYHTPSYDMLVLALLVLGLRMSSSRGI